MTNTTTAKVTPADVATVTPVKAPDKRELSNTARAAVVALQKAREAQKAAKADADVAEAVIREALNGSRVGTVGGMTVVRVQPGSNSNFDRELLATAYPEAYDATLRTTKYDSLRLA